MPLATAVSTLGLLQQLQHFLDDGLQRPAQLIGIVGFAQRRHVYEGRSALALVQRCIVREVAKVPDGVVGRESGPSRGHQKPDQEGDTDFDCLFLPSLATGIWGWFRLLDTKTRWAAEFPMDRLCANFRAENWTS